MQTELSPADFVNHVTIRADEEELAYVTDVDESQKLIDEDEDEGTDRDVNRSGGI